MIIIIYFLEIDMDRTRTWCPRAGCETVCSVAAPDGTIAAAGAASTAAGSSLGAAAPRRPPVCAVQCPTCSDEFCSSCKKQVRDNNYLNTNSFFSKSVFTN